MREGPMKYIDVKGKFMFPQKHLFFFFVYTGNGGHKFFPALLDL